MPGDLFPDLEVRAAEEPRPDASPRRVSLPLVTLPGAVTLPVLTNEEIDELPG